MQAMRPRHAPAASTREDLMRRSMEKWDVHTHTTLSPDTYASLARFTRHADFVRVRAREGAACGAEIVDATGRVQRVIEPNAYDSKVRLAECDAHGVAMQVISPTPMMIPDYVDNAADAAEICIILNDGNAKIAADFPQRFMALACLPMLHVDAALKELERVRAFGVKGITINSNIDGLDLDDPRLYPVFEAAAHHGMAVFVHPWGGFMKPSEERLRKRMHADYNWRPWLVAMGKETSLAFDAMRSGGVHERLPQLRVLYAHGGGMFPALLGRLSHGAYCRPDLFSKASPLNPYDTISKCGIYVDTLTHDPWVLDMLVHTLGAQRIAMGSDYPYPMGEMDPFDPVSLKDMQGNTCPYGKTKGIYPGHMIEHLPESDADMEAAWRHFNWLARENADGPRRLPVLNAVQKQRILSGTAKEWLRCA